MAAKPGRVRVRSRGRVERDFAAQGVRVAGVDEVGKGCLAGPVFAAAAVLDHARLVKLSAKVRRQIRDSKLLTGAQRAAIIPVIREIAVDTRIASASVREIETLGIAPATHLAACRALKALAAPFDLLLVDGKWPIKGHAGPQQPIIKGDNLCHVIAAAAILAKEARDQFMREQAALHPQYGFELHVGYATQLHMDMIERHGISPLHRRNFAPIRARVNALGGKSATITADLTVS
jgi:ribonuclease HII